MKKLLFTLLCLSAWSSTPTYADGNQIRLIMEGVDDTPHYPGHGKAPMRTPYIHQDGYTLTLSNVHPEYLINIVQGEDAVFSTIIPEGVVTYELPSYLSGEFTILLVSGNICLYGLINL